MDSTELERRKRVIDELVDGIVDGKQFFAARGVDVGDPVDREVMDTFKRIERRMRASDHPTGAYQEAE